MDINKPITSYVEIHGSEIIHSWYGYDSAFKWFHLQTLMEQFMNMTYSPEYIYGNIAFTPLWF